MYVDWLYVSLEIIHQLCRYIQTSLRNIGTNFTHFYFLSSCVHLQIFLTQCTFIKLNYYTSLNNTKLVFNTLLTSITDSIYYFFNKIGNKHSFQTNLKIKEIYSAITDILIFG